MAQWRSTLCRRRDAGRGERALVAEAFVWLLLARLALIVVPFPVLARRLGTFVAPGDGRAIAAQSDGTAARADTAGRIGLAVNRAARNAPFTAVCLPQAMAARIMLTRRGIPSVLHFGAAKGRRKAVDAHAWLDAGGVEVSGYPVAAKFTEIACFI